MRLQSLSIVFAVLLVGCDRPDDGLPIHNAEKNAEVSNVGDSKHSGSDLAPAKAVLLERVLTAGKSKENEAYAAEMAVKELVSEHVIQSAPDYRQDYSSYYIPKSSIKVFGKTVLALEYEYVDVWNGCCVNDGLAVLFKPGEPGIELVQYAKKNGCAISTGKDVFIPAEFSSMLGGASYAKLSCKERDEFVENSGVGR